MLSIPIIGWFWIFLQAFCLCWGRDFCYVLHLHVDFWRLRKLLVWHIRFLSGGGPGLFEVNYSQAWSGSGYTLSTWYQDFSVCSLIFAILVHSSCFFFSNFSQHHPRPTTKIHSIDWVCVTSSRFYVLICFGCFCAVCGWLGMKMQLPVSLQREGCGRNWCEHGMSKGIFYQGTIHFVSVCQEIFRSCYPKRWERSEMFEWFILCMKSYLPLTTQITSFKKNVLEGPWQKR